MSNILDEQEKKLVEELLILNSIIYTDDFSNGLVDEIENVYDWANKFDVDSISGRQNLPAEINEKEFQTIIDTIKMNKEVYSKMEIVDVSRYKANQVLGGKGVSATIEYDNSYVVIYKGTAGSIDWNDNELGGYSKVSDTEQQEAAVEYFERMMDIKPNHVNKIYVTGHSKGGNKAQYVGVKRGDKIDHVYSFDGQNFNDTFAFKYNRELGRYKDKITNISNKYDFVNILFPRI